MIAENMFQGVVFMVNTRPLRLKPCQQVFDAFYLVGFREGSSPGTGEHLGGEVVEQYGDLSEPKSAGSVFKGFVWRSFVLRKLRCQTQNERKRPQRFGGPLKRRTIACIIPTSDSSTRAKRSFC